MLKKLNDKQCFYIAYYGSTVFMAITLLFLLVPSFSSYWTALGSGLLLLMFIWIVQSSIKRLKPKE